MSGIANEPMIESITGRNAVPPRYIDYVCNSGLPLLDSFARMVRHGGHPTVEDNGDQYVTVSAYDIPGALAVDFDTCFPDRHHHLDLLPGARPNR